MSVDEFVAAATDSKATVEQQEISLSTDEHKLKPGYRMSAPYGGCGLSSCRCSPGLWVSFFDFAERKRVLAHFGTDIERGGDGLFDEDDFDRWRKLCKRMVERGLAKI